MQTTRYSPAAPGTKRALEATIRIGVLDVPEKGPKAGN
jgi:hypothetical protein